MADSNREEIAKLETLFAAHPEGRIFTHLAEAYRKAGELDRAREVLDKGLERHADYSSAYVVLGRVQADSGAADAARTSFRRVLDLDPQNLVALRALGDLARDAGDPREALEFYEKLAGAEPGNEELQAQIAALTAEVTAAREQQAGEQAAADAAASAAAAAAAHVEPMDLTIGGVAAGGLEEDSGFLSLEPPDVSTLDLSGMTFTSDEEPQDAFSELEVEREAEAEPEAAPEAEPAPFAEAEAEAEGEAEAEAEGEVEAEAGAGAQTADEFAEEWEPEAESAPAGEFAEEWAPEAESASEWEPQPEAETEPSWAEAEPEAQPAPEAMAEAEEALPPAGSPDEAPVVVTETIADLYLQQGLGARAAEVYQRLLQERPGDEDLLRKLEAAKSAGVRAQEAEPPAAELDFEIQPDISESPFPPAAEDALLTEEQEQEQILAVIEPDPVVSSSMEGYFEELFGQIPPDVAAARAGAAAETPDAPAAEGAEAEPPSEISFFMTDMAAEQAEVTEPVPAADRIAEPATPTQPDWEALAASVRWEPPLPEPGSEEETAPAATEGGVIGEPASDPWIEAAAEDELAEEPPLERIESAWTGGGGALGTEPTPYAWDGRDAGPEEGDQEESVTDYLQSLLSWRPRTATPVREEDTDWSKGEEAEDSAASAAFEAALISPNQPRPVSEEPAALPEPVMPAPPEAAMPALPAAAEDEIDALFNAAPAATPAPVSNAAPPAPDEAASAESGAEDEAEDLEVFRTWLQSLKH